MGVLNDSLRNVGELVAGKEHVPAPLEILCNGSRAERMVSPDAHAQAGANIVERAHPMPFRRGHAVERLSCQRTHASRLRLCGDPLTKVVGGHAACLCGWNLPGERPGDERIRQHRSDQGGEPAAREWECVLHEQDGKFSTGTRECQISRAAVVEGAGGREDRRARLAKALECAVCRSRVDRHHFFLELTLLARNRSEEVLEAGARVTSWNDNRDAGRRHDIDDAAAAVRWRTRAR